MSKKPVKFGRPTKLTPSMEDILERALRDGATIEQACVVAGINKTSFYLWKKTNPTFATKMAKAKEYPNIIAKKVIVDKIVKDKDDTNARWWLEKKEFKNVNQTNIQVNVKPILGGKTTSNVYRNDSGEETAQIEEEN